MRASFLPAFLLAAACKHSEAPAELETPGLLVYGTAKYRCDQRLEPAARLPVTLRAEEEILGETVTSSVGSFSLEGDTGAEQGRFILSVGEANVRVSGSTRLRYRVVVTLPCNDEDRQAGPARVMSEVWPEER